MTDDPIESGSGIAIVVARVRDFRSLANIEVQLSDLTVLLGANNAGKTSFLDALFAAIGAGRRSLNVDDVRLAPGEPSAPRTREVVIDVMLRPPLRADRFADGFVTLYTAEYDRSTFEVTYHWPQAQWRQPLHGDLDSTLDVDLASLPLARALGSV